MSKKLDYFDIKIEILEELLKKYPKEVLLAPIRSDALYKNTPRIKGIRDQNVKPEHVYSLYIKEYTKNNKCSLARNLKVLVNSEIKSSLSKESYDKLIEGNYTLDELKEIKKEYDEEKGRLEDLFFKIINHPSDIEESVSLLVLEDEVKTLSNDKEDLIKDIEDYKKEISILQEEVKNKDRIINDLKEDNNKLKEEHASYQNIYEKDYIHHLLHRNFNEIEYKEVSNLMKDYHNEHIDFHKIQEYFYLKKKELYKNKDIKKIKNILFIEYLLTEIEEGLDDVLQG